MRSSEESLSAPMNHRASGGKAMGRKEYRVRRIWGPVRLNAGWSAPDWQPAPPVRLSYFRPESSGHRPHTEVRLLHSEAALYGLFRVQDRYVRAVCRRYQDAVCRDSCVEFFVRPQGHGGYFNFEFNCVGTLLCSFVEDWRRTPNGFRQYQRIPWEVGQSVRVWHSLTWTGEAEMAGPLEWFLAFEIPRELLERYRGPLGQWGGQVWTGNFYKCADGSSHPHWAAWSPVPELNFHLPESFGRLILEQS